MDTQQQQQPPTSPVVATLESDARGQVLRLVRGDVHRRIRVHPDEIEPLANLFSTIHEDMAEVPEALRSAPRALRQRVLDRYGDALGSDVWTAATVLLADYQSPDDFTAYCACKACACKLLERTEAVYLVAQVATADDDAEDAAPESAVSAPGATRLDAIKARLAAIEGRLDVLDGIAQEAAAERLGEVLNDVLFCGDRT